MNLPRIATSGIYLASALAALVMGCRPGLPPEPPGRDAADAEATATRYDPPSNPYESSAFEGAKLPSSSGHDGMKGMKGMNHEGMEGMDSGAAAKPADAPKKKSQETSAASTSNGGSKS